MNEALLWSVSASIVASLNAMLHRQGDIGREALAQLVVSGLAGALPMFPLPLPPLANREVMVALYRVLISMLMEERRCGSHAFDAVMSDTTALLAFALRGPVSSSTLSAPGTNGGSSGVGYPMSTSTLSAPGTNGGSLYPPSGNLANLESGFPRPNEAPLGTSTTGNDLRASRDDYVPYAGVR
jgi:hypothetical protein